MEQENYIVYVRADGQSRILEANSSAFLTDTTGWTAIDEGLGDKYHHAQGNYFDKPIYTEDGVPRYKLVDGQPVERTEEEIQQDLEILISNTPLSNDLQTKLAIAELAELENAHDLENKLSIAELAELLLGGDK